MSHRHRCVRMEQACLHECFCICIIVLERRLVGFCDHFGDSLLQRRERLVSEDILQPAGCTSAMVLTLIEGFSEGSADLVGKLAYSSAQPARRVSGAPHEAFAGVLLPLLRCHAVHAVEIAGSHVGIAELQASSMARGGEGSQGSEWLC